VPLRRKAAERTIPDLWRKIRSLLRTICSEECANFFRHGLYLPILAAQFVVPEKIRLFAIIGSMLVVIGTALEIVSVWPTQDIDAAQSTNDSE
jgi:hypothetical protein